MADEEKYPSCKHIERTQLDNTIDEDVAREIGQNYRTIPTFEKGLYEHKCIQQYSLRNNRLLGCRWRAYVEGLQHRVFSPFYFPNDRDLHFHIGTIRYDPSLSIHRMTDFRMKVMVGPGFDHKGELPIPQELLMKRGKVEKEKDGRRTGLSAKKKNGDRK